MFIRNILLICSFTVLRTYFYPFVMQGEWRGWLVGEKGIEEKYCLFYGDKILICILSVSVLIGVNKHMYELNRTVNWINELWFNIPPTYRSGEIWQLFEKMNSLSWELEWCNLAIHCQEVSNVQDSMHGFCLVHGTEIWEVVCIYYSNMEP